MLDFLYSFGIGISFAVGVCCGGFLCQMATRAGRKDFEKAVEETNRMTETRMRDFVNHTDRIACVLEEFAEYKRADRQQ